jgi:Undecaprenyl-phosphate glucose phosphotransferase
MGYVGDGLDTGMDAVPVAASAQGSAFDISGDQAASWPALLVDALAIVALSVVTGVGYDLLAKHVAAEYNFHLFKGLLIAVIFCSSTRLSGSTHRLSVSRDWGRARLAFITWSATFLFLTAVVFSLKIGAVFSRGANLIYFFSGLPVVMATRVFVPRILARTLFAQAYRGSEVLIAAPRGEPMAGHLAHQLRQQGCSGVHLFEFDGDCGHDKWLEERQALLRRMLDTARIAGPGEIYVLSGTVSEDRIAAVLSGLRLVPRATFVLPAPSVADLLGLPIRRLGLAIAVETKREPMSFAAHMTKRLIDLFVASIALLVTAPLFLAIAVAIKFDSSGPVFFRQRRIGHRGRPFRIFKFRSMTVLEDGAVVAQARRDDQRVTKVGRWLRRTSLDELPQLFNILKGEMSLVGPRPHAVAHDELYVQVIENYELRQHVKPGVTGWAQVNGLRGETPTVDLMLRRIEFDLWYAANCSVMLDIQILFRTLFTVLGQENAY